MPHRTCPLTIYIGLSDMFIPMVVPLCFDSRRDPFICVSLVVTLNIFYYGRDPRSFLVYPFGRDPDVFYFGRDPSFVVLSSFFFCWAVTPMF